MHSRIFQVSLNPINKEDYIDCSTYDYDHWFVNEVADYIIGSADRKGDIEWLKESVNGCTFGEDDNGKFFIVDSKEEYFSEAFDRFKEAIGKIRNIRIKEFVSKYELSHAIWEVEDAYEDNRGFYVDADGEVMTMDAFIRRCLKGEKYYIGGICNYHY